MAGACVCSPEREGFLCALGGACVGLVSLDEIVRCINTVTINYYYLSVFYFPSLTCSCFFNSFTVRVGKLSLGWRKKKSIRRRGGGGGGGLSLIHI